MAQQEFTRYVGYDDPDVFRGFLIDQFAAVQKNGVFIKEKLPAPSTDDIAKAAQYTASSFDSARNLAARQQHSRRRRGACGDYGKGGFGMWNE